MKKYISGLWSNQLVRGTTILFAGSTLVNLGGFFYHLILARLLGPVEYGSLAALLGLTYLVSIPIGSMDLLVTKMVSSFESSHLLSHTRSFLFYVFNIVCKISFVAFPILVLSTGKIQDFLHLNSPWGIIFTWISVILWLVITLFRSALKGLVKFEGLVTSQIIEMAFRVILSVGLIVFVGKSYLNAQIGTIVASLIGLGVALYFLKPLLKVPSTKFEHHKWPLKSLGLTSFLLAASYSSMYSMDIILVKHFFSEHLAGVYAVLATAGKIIFFAESSVASSIIPIVSRKSDKPWTARKDLLTLILLSSLISIPALIIYWLAPNLVINLIFTSQFSEASPLLFGMGTALMFYSLANISSSFLLSIGKNKMAVISVIALVTEILAILVFHSSLKQIVVSLNIVFGILAAVLIVYSFYATRKT